MIQIDGATITKTTSGVFIALIAGDWFAAAALAEKIQRVAGRKPIKIYPIGDFAHGVEVG